MAAKTTLNAKNLEALGAARLAELLLEISTGSALAKRRLRLELAGAQSTTDAAREVAKRLTTIAGSRARVGWRSRKGLVADLDTQLQAIARIAEGDASEALALTWRFLQIATPLFQRCDDSSGQVIAVFHRACGLLGQIAPQATTPEALADAAFDALQDNMEGQYDQLIPALAEALGPQGLAHLKARVQVLAQTPVPVPPKADWVLVSHAGGVVYAHQLAESARASVVRLALQDIADALGDVDAFIAQHDARTAKMPAVATEIARRLMEAGRPEEALSFLTAAEGRPEPQAITLRLQALETLGRPAEAQAFRLSCFHRDLDPAMLRAYLKKLADFEDIEAEEAAMAHVMAHPVAARSLGFLLAWPNLRLAAQLIQSRRVELDGDQYDLLTQAAEALAERYPLASTLALRAMVDFTLTSGRSTRYAHAARHLDTAAELAPMIETWGKLPPHESYVAHLRRDHARKAGFWGQVGR